MTRRNRWQKAHPKGEVGDGDQTEDREISWMLIPNPSNFLQKKTQSSKRPLDTGRTL
jgi:hypothetical protein